MPAGVVLTFGGSVLAWAGGYLLSSGYDRCVDGPNSHSCTGTFASDTWYGVGIAAIISGVILMLAAGVTVVKACRRCLSDE